MGWEKVWQDAVGSVSEKCKSTSGLRHSMFLKHGMSGTRENKSSDTEYSSFGGGGCKI